VKRRLHVIIIRIKSVARMRLVKAVNHSVCATVNFEVYIIAIVLYCL
jgi:hypothetical protein